MAVRNVDPDKPPRHIGRAAKKVGEAAKAGKLVPLRSGQKHRRGNVKAKKKRELKDPIEATDVTARADVMIGADAWGLRTIRDIKTLYLYVASEQVGGGCYEGLLKVTRYPRTMRWKAGLKFQMLVVIANPKWARLTDEEQSRALFHALNHFWTDSEGVLRLQKHEFADFYKVVDRFGIKVPEIKKIAEQLELAAARP